MPARNLEPVPTGYHVVTPWIISNNSDALASFIKKVFGGEERGRVLNDDGSVGHLEIQIGDSIVMLFDSRQGWPETPSFLRLYVEDAENVISLAEEEGASVVTRLTALFFGDKVGRIRDLWGNIWWIQQRMEEVDWSEQEKRMNDPAAIKAMKYVQESLDKVMRQSLLTEDL
jgi:PhnB protein